MSASARGPICPLGTPAGRRARCGLPHAVQRPALQPVLVDARPHRRHVEHLVAQRLAISLNRAAALARLGRRALDDAVDLALGQQRSKGAAVSRLATTPAPADPPPGALAPPGAIRRRRLRGVARVELQALFEPGQPLLRLRELPPQLLDDLVALRHRLRLVRVRPGRCLGRCVVTLHPPSVAANSATGKRRPTPRSLQADCHPIPVARTGGE